MRYKFKIAPRIWLCAVIILSVTLIALFPNLFTKRDPNSSDLMSSNIPPALAGGSFDHFWGTDGLGRDLYARCIYGTRVTCGMAFMATVLGMITGTAFGVLSGYFNGWVERILMLLVDFQYSVPFMLMVLLGISLFGKSIFVLAALIGFAKWENYGKVARALVLTAKQNQYVEAAYMMNAGHSYVIFRHILRGIFPSVIVLMTLNFPAVMLLESSLSFLGIGIQPPTATLGRMIGEGRNFIMFAPWVVLVPALFIVAISLSVQTMGDWLSDRLNAKLDQI